MLTVSDVDSLDAHVGQLIGTSGWLDVDQARIDIFADATDDHQWIHVDAARAAEGPFGATIAHGYLILSLLAPMVRAVLDLEGTKQAVNYGLGKVRFTAPVRAGSQICGHAVLAQATRIDATVQLALDWTVEVSDSDRPACVAEQLLRVYL